MNNVGRRVEREEKKRKFCRVGASRERGRIQLRFVQKFHSSSM